MNEYIISQLEFGDKKQRTKIRGSQFVKREEKIKPKLTIRNPFKEWKNKQPKLPRSTR